MTTYKLFISGIICEFIQKIPAKRPGCAVPRSVVLSALRSVLLPWEVSAGRRVLSPSWKSGSSTRLSPSAHGAGQGQMAAGLPSVLPWPACCSGDCGEYCRSAPSVSCRGRCRAGTAVEFEIWDTCVWSLG